MMKNLLLPGFLMLTTILAAQHPNVLVGDAGNPNEPSICLDPKYPNRIVAGSNLNDVYVSSDTGHTWVHSFLSSPFGVWGDPTIGVDTSGSFYFFHLSNPPSPGSWIDRIVCQKSTDIGQNWTQGTFTGLNNGKAQDKQWLTVDRKTNYLYVSWTEFDHYGTSNPQDSSRILFSKSMDGGNTWSSAKRLNKISGDCVDSDNTTEGAVPCIGPNGEIYVTWAGPEGLLFDRSLDGGNTWLAEDIKIDDFPTGWDYGISGLGRCNGLPISVCDLSGGLHNGTIYVNWSDQRNGSENTDVWLSKSTDGGNTWSPAARVNNDTGTRHQFMSWMAIDQATGWLWFVFYDRRNYSDNKTDVYMAVSKDGGDSFVNFKISETPFNPADQHFFGDYTNLSVYNNIVRPIWTRMNDAGTSVWTALVNVSAIPVVSQTNENPSDKMEMEPGYPNPAGASIWVPFKIRRHTLVSLQVLDNEGKILETIFTDRPYEYGKYTEQIDLKTLGLPAGTYWIMLSGDGKVMTQKTVVINP